jgi:two-component system sensor histidine kinase UhpB
VLTAVGVGVAYFTAQHFTRPIKRLVTAAERMASDDLETRVEGVTSGELGELARSFNKMAQELQAKVQDLQESRTRIVMVQEGLRREIASHLHGRVQGRLLVLKARLQELLGETNSTTNAEQTLREVVDQMDQISEQEISVLSRRLYPAMLRRGLVPALQSLGDQFEAALDIRMELDEQLMQQERANRNLIPEQVRLAAYRIAEEALTNVLKHAKARAATVHLDLPGGGGLHLMVRDNGQGFNMEAASGGLGMAAIQDHAGAVGGRCVVRSAPGEGTEITATFPFVGPVVEHPGRVLT